MAIMTDIKETIIALGRSEATPDQQREAAALLLLLKELEDWNAAEAAYMTLKVSGLIGGHPGNSRGGCSDAS